MVCLSDMVLQHMQRQVAQHVQRMVCLQEKPNGITDGGRFCSTAVNAIHQHGGFLSSQQPLQTQLHSPLGSVCMQKTQRRFPDTRAREQCTRQCPARHWHLLFGSSRMALWASSLHLTTHLSITPMFCPCFASAAPPFRTLLDEESSGLSNAGLCLDFATQVSSLGFATPVCSLRVATPVSGESPTAGPDNTSHIA